MKRLFPGRGHRRWFAIIALSLALFSLCPVGVWADEPAPDRTGCDSADLGAGLY